MRESYQYVSIPGSKLHELPPLLVHCGFAPLSELDLVDMASAMVEAEEMLPDTDTDERLIEQRKEDLAVSLAEQYRQLISHWQWGDSILEWIRQCETTFENESSLRALLHPDVWPHANRASFVVLLADKGVPTHGVKLFNAVGLRLTFRQPPPIGCVSDQFLFYLNSTVADTAYRTWAQLNLHEPAYLPPDRFHFEVLDLDQQ